MGPSEPEFTCSHGATFGGVDNAVDQVKRKLAFEAEHPEWRIAYDRDYRVFRALRLLDGGEDNVTRYELRDLMDELEGRTQ